MKYVLIAIIVIVAILIILYIAVKASQSAARRVEQTEKKAKDNTFFMRDMTAKAESLMKSAKKEQAKQAAKEVYELFRYSEPLSTGESTEIDQQIQTEFEKFSKQLEQLSADSAEQALVDTDTLKVLLNQRTALLKSNK